MQPLPVDTTALVQSVSTIGLKYLALEKGHSARPLKAGQTIPVSQTREPVDIDQFFNMFDKKTRIANQVNLTSFGNGLAGRGIGLNETIATLRPLVTNAIPVLHNLASPQTGFGRALRRARPRRQRSGAGGKRTGGPLQRPRHVLHGLGERRAVAEQSIEGGPPALHQATVSLPFEAEFVNKSATFMRLLRPSARILTTVAAPLGHAFSVGAVNVRAATALAPEMNEASQAFAAFAQEPDRDERHRRPDAHARARQPAARGTGAGADELQLRDARVPQPRERAVRERRRRHSRPRRAGARAERAQQRGPALLCARERPRDRQPPARQPLPERGRSRSAAQCEAGNEPYKPGKTVTGNVPGGVGAKTETTSRETNLYGEKYPSQTLEALGLKGSKGAKK